MRDVTTLFKRARRKSTPLIAAVTPDPAAFIESIKSMPWDDLLEGEYEPLFYVWDLMRGFISLTEKAEQMLTSVNFPTAQQRDALVEPAVFLATCRQLPQGAVVFALNLHHFLDGERLAPAVIQGIWNLREPFKANQRMFVLVDPDLQLPVELRQDVLVLTEDLPDDAALAEIILSQFKAASLPEPGKDDVRKGVDAIRGLAAFPAEQIVAMSLTKKGLDYEALRTRTRATLEQTKGIKVDRETATTSAVGGLSQILKFFKGVFTGKRPPALIVRLEEIEKAIAGSGVDGGAGDQSGVTQDRLGTILTEMEDNEWTGLIAVGHAGTGKSFISKVIGNSYDVMSMTLDLGALSGSLVGESEQAVRDAMRIIKARAGHGGAFFIATCNKLDTLPPALIRRFRMGTWFFDLPGREDKDAVWAIQLAAFGLDKKSKRPDDTDWTPSDIRNCCDLADRLSLSLVEAAQYLVPVAKSDPQAIEDLRSLANNRFLSAATPGPYKKALAGGVITSRKVGVE